MTTSIFHCRLMMMQMILMLLLMMTLTVVDGDYDDVVWLLQLLAVVVFLQLND